MLQQTRLELIASISYICKYPIFLFENGRQLGHEEFTRIMPEKQLIHPFLCDEALLSGLLDAATDEPQIIKEGEHVHYGVKRIRPQLVCIAGPIGTFDISRGEIREYSKKHHVTNSNHYFMHKASRRKTLALLSVVHHCFTGEYIALRRFLAVQTRFLPNRSKQNYLIISF